MSLAAQAGLEGPPYEVDIERGKIREFARAMAAPLPEFMQDRRAVVPATFFVSVPYSWGYSLERPRGTVFQTIEHDLSVSLHAQESFRFFGPPPRAGDRLIAYPKLESVTEKHGKAGGKLTFLTMLTDYRNEAGKTRVEQRSVSVTTGETPGSQNWKTVLPDYAPKAIEPEPPSPFAAVSRVDYAGLSPADSPGPVSAGPLILRDIVRFQGVVGEDDPLHYDTHWAKQQGFPAPFGLGMHQASLMAAYAAHWLAPGAVRSYQVRFRDMVWPGDELIYCGQVSALERETATASLKLTCSRPGGDPVSDALMTFDFSQVQGT